MFSTLQPSNEYESWQFLISSSNYNGFSKIFHVPKNMNYGNFLISSSNYNNFSKIFNFFF